MCIPKIIFARSNLKFQSNSGEACTCVVTEYHYHDSNNFAIEKDFFSIEEINKQITELLQSYRHYHVHRMDMEGDEERDCKKKAEIARDTFRAMFRGRLESLQFLTDEPEGTVLTILLSWAQDIAPSIISGREVRPLLADCSALLMQLTSEQNSVEEPAVWPYIRKIKFVKTCNIRLSPTANNGRVFSKAHILSKGLVLVDLPGGSSLPLIENQKLSSKTFSTRTTRFELCPTKDYRG